ncbi:WD40-repeat-containing domain protein, partial [Pelagophyceae sp. CCMP2097]
MSFGSFLQDRHLRGAASCGSQSPLRRDVRWADKLQLVGVLEAHGGCVNAVRWSAAGDLLVSGSDDRRCCVWSAAGALLATRNTRHHRNIFDACFVPDGAARIVTCAADGCVGLTQGVDGPNIGAALLYASPQAGCIASKLSFLPTQPEVFLAAFSDGKIRLFDLRLNTRGRERVVLDLDGVGATAVEFKPRSDVVFAVGADDVQLRVCDLRRAGDSDQAAAWTDDGHAATATMRDGAAATMRDGAATATRADAGAPATTSRPLRQDWTRDANRPAAADASEAWEDSEDSDDSEDSLAFARSFRGRRNVETCAKEARWLFGDAVVATGGDDGALYLWDAETAAPLSKRRADRCVVNSIAPHPFDLGLATSGIDSEVKLW